MGPLTPLELATRQIEFARQYTLSLLANLDDSDWYRRPPGCATHIAWQVGHLAVAQYGLCLFRIRGRQPIDTELMPSPFRKRFSKGSQPDDEVIHSPAEIRTVFDRVYGQALTELAGRTEKELAMPVDEPYAVTPTKLGGLLFCSGHEMLHAGQIGLIRRLLGKTAVR